MVRTGLQALIQVTLRGLDPDRKREGRKVLSSFSGEGIAAPLFLAKLWVGVVLVPMLLCMPSRAFFCDCG